jgi:hypothetical protein
MDAKRALVKRARQPCDNNKVNYVVLTGSTSGPGLSLVTAAVARSLHLHGFRVAPLYLGPPTQQTFPCPEGGTISRPAAILAEACGILPEARFEGLNPSAFGRDFDWLVVQAAEFNQPLEHCRRLAVSPHGPGYQITGDNLNLQLPAPPEVTLSPEILPEVEALPPYRPGLPRIGVVSLPHITNFDDFLKVPGAEWIAFPLPGRLDVIFYPDTSSLDSDNEWLGIQGLDNWLTLQRAMGCRMVTTGYPLPGAYARLTPGDIKDPNRLSLALGAKVQPPLPDESSLDLLALWWETAFGAHPDLLAV